MKNSNIYSLKIDIHIRLVISFYARKATHFLLLSANFYKNNSMHQLLITCTQTNTFHQLSSRLLWLRLKFPDGVFQWHDWCPKPRRSTWREDVYEKNCTGKYRQDWTAGRRSPGAKACLGYDNSNITTKYIIIN